MLVQAEGLGQATFKQRVAGVPKPVAKPEEDELLIDLGVRGQTGRIPPVVDFPDWNACVSGANKALGKDFEVRWQKRCSRT